MDCSKRTRRRIAPPQIFDDAVKGHDVVDVEQQHGQNGPLLGRSELDRRRPLPRRDGTEDGEAHATLSQPMDTAAGIL